MHVPKFCKYTGSRNLTFSFLSFLIKFLSLLIRVGSGVLLIFWIKPSKKSYTIDRLVVKQLTSDKKNRFPVRFVLMYIFMVHWNLDGVPKYPHKITKYHKVWKRNWDTLAIVNSFASFSGVFYLPAGRCKLQTSWVILLVHKLCHKISFIRLLVFLPFQSRSLRIKNQWFKSHLR